ncbi:MAG TPA: hypothetical protein VNT52_07375, partial [Acidimicrobiales bacterium]|nr:hypothetical protein [Acidimicrobiales bacterium]
MFAYGAAAALIISFAGLAVFWRTTRLEGGVEGRVVLAPGRLQRGLLVAGRALGMVLYALLVVAAVFGAPVTAENIAPVFVYVVFWVGMTLTCALVGNLWRVVNPFDTMAAAVERLRGDRRVAPYRWGRWPAVAALAGFVWLELVPSNRAEPSTLAVAVLLYTVVVLAGVARWGRDWLEQGEGFTVFFGLLANMAPFYADGEGRVRARPHLTGLVGLKPDAALQAIVIVALGSTSFDGLSRTRFWIDLTRNMSSMERTLLSTAGLIWSMSVVTLAFVGAMRITGRLHRRRFDQLSASFVHSLVPIAFAYALAHYFSLLVFEGQSAIALASDPLGRGWDLFGTAGNPVNFTLVSTTVIAYVQASGIIAGHVAGDDAAGL